MKRVKRVLMCRPIHYDVEYIINPWMKPGTVDTDLALEQWDTLVSTYKKLGVKVEVIDQKPSLPDMVFAADQGVVRDGRIVLSNFKYPQRMKERIPYISWLEGHGFEIEIIPEGYFFEGSGECLFKNEKTVYVGTGFRTTSEGAKRLGEVLDVEVIALELIDPRFYHLDTCFFPLHEDTAFYYPPAFSSLSQKFIAQNVAKLIEFSKSEVMGFAANNVVVGSTVITQKGNNTFVRKLKKLDYKVIELDLSEFMKAGGGIHCLTNILE